MTMRRVMLTKKVYPSVTSDKYTLVEDGEAWFHCWGLACKEKGGSSFTVAIVERDDGRVDTTTPYRIRFLEPPPAADDPCVHEGPLPTNFIAARRDYERG